MKEFVWIILSVVAIVLLIISQILWIRQLAMRDRERLEMELQQSLYSIVPFCLSRELSKKRNADKQDFELVPPGLSQIPDDSIIRGSFDTKEYQPDKNLGHELVYGKD